MSPVYLCVQLFVLDKVIYLVVTISGVLGHGGGGSVEASSVDG